MYETPRKKLNTSLSAVGISPINLHGIPSHSRSSSAKSKLTKVVQKFKTDISEAYNVDDVQLDSNESTSITREIENKAVELDRL